MWSVIAMKPAIAAGPTLSRGLGFPQKPRVRVFEHSSGVGPAFQTGARRAGVVIYEDGPNVRFLVALVRRFPQWAIWLPSRGQWTAARAWPGMRPGPQAELVWVQASSARQLCVDIEKGRRQGGANGYALVSTDILCRSAAQLCRSAVADTAVADNRK